MPLTSRDDKSFVLTPVEVEFEKFLNSHDDGKLLGSFKREWFRDDKRKLHFFFPKIRFAIELIDDFSQSAEVSSGANERNIWLEARSISICRVVNSEVFGCRKMLIGILRAGWIAAKKNSIMPPHATIIETRQAAKAPPTKQPILEIPKSKARKVRQSDFNGGWTSIDQGVNRMGASITKTYVTEGFGGSRDAVRNMKRDISSDSKKRNK